jgi:hypothetical protein
MPTSAQRAARNIKVPYAEATFSLTLANNSFASPSAFTSVQDNGLQTLGFNIVNTSGSLTLGAKGAWLVTSTVTWAAGAASTYRMVSLILNFAGGTHGEDIVLSPVTSAFDQSTAATIQVATNPGYSVLPQLYQNSGASNACTGVVRAIHLGGITP